MWDHSVISPIMLHLTNYLRTLYSQVLVIRFTRHFWSKQPSKGKITTLNAVAGKTESRLCSIMFMRMAPVVKMLIWFRDPEGAREEGTSC